MKSKIQVSCGKSMNWVRGDTVGHGNFATVNLVIPRSRSRTQPLMAVKSCGVLHSASLLNEMLILEELNNCPEIIRYFGNDFSFENGEKIYNMFLEYASGGDLADKVKKSGNSGLPESDVRRFAKSILKGLRYIHNHGYVHCDIKLQNCLLFSSQHDGEDMVKIADFGLAKKSGIKGEKVGFELKGTPIYMSPEMVARGEQEPPADIWALGCMVSQMVSGTPAWLCGRDCGIGQLLLRIGIGDEVPEIPTKLSEEGKDFLEKCFVKDAGERCTAETLLNHPFVTDHDDETFRASPKNPFNFFNWLCINSSVTSSISFVSLSESKQWSQHTLKLTSRPKRLQWRTVHQPPDWSLLKSSITVRKREQIQSPESDKCCVHQLKKLSFTSPWERLQYLTTDQGPDWSVSKSWITVHKA